jgi:hypothetical protein
VCQAERGSEITNCLSFESSDRKNRQESSVYSDFWDAADVTVVDKVVKLPDEGTRERWDAHQDACLDVAILGRLSEIRRRHECRATIDDHALRMKRCAAARLAR